MLFQSKLGWSLLELLERSTDSGCPAPLRKIRSKKDRRGSPIASPMAKSALSSGRENQLLREWIFVRIFHRWGGLVFIMDDHDNFPSWMMIRIFLPLGEGFSFLIVIRLIRDNL